MNNQSSFGYAEEQPGGQDQPRPPVSPFGGQYKFSPDELRVLQQCNVESFYQRSLPIGSLLGFGAYAAIRQGRLRPNARFGALPKVSLAVIVGYFIGKISYQQACAEKLMALPGSYIGQLLRDKRDGKPSSPPPPGSGLLGASAEDIYSDAGTGSSLDFDSERPPFSEDGYRPDTHPSGPNADAAPPTRPASSYEELRRKNRGAHLEARQDPYRVDSGAEVLTPPPITRARPPPASKPHTNQYGDVIE